MQLIWPGAMAAQAVYVAAKLGIADLLAKVPKTIEDLAAATHTHGPILRRLLSALACMGLFEEDGAGRFHNSELSETLRSDHPESIRPWAIMLGAPFIWRPAGELMQATSATQPVFSSLFGEGFFNYLGTHPEDAKIFGAAMAASSRATAAAVIATYDFSRFKRVVDVGGGQGAFLAGVLAANPNLRGVLFDLPAAVAGASVLRNGDFAGRCEIVAGNFFEGIPKGGDAYVLKGVIHGWSDENALKILKNCRASMEPDGTLILLEVVLDGEPGRAMLDLLMLVLAAGRERTESDFKALLEQAGFSLSRVIPTPWSALIEARPA